MLGPIPCACTKHLSNCQKIEYCLYLAQVLVDRAVLFVWWEIVFLFPLLFTAGPLAGILGLSCLEHGDLQGRMVVTQILRVVSSPEFTIRDKAAPKQACTHIQVDPNLGMWEVTKKAALQCKTQALSTPPKGCKTAINEGLRTGVDISHRP